MIKNLRSQMMEALKKELKAFVSERNWEIFHTPKNLLLSLCSEVGELADLLRWLTPEESLVAMNDEELSQKIEEEMADIFNNLLLLAMKLNLDLIAASTKKLNMDRKKYPADEWKGKALEKPLTIP